MLKASVAWPQSKALQRYLDGVVAATRPGGKARTRFMGDLATIVREDHADMLARGVTRYGTPRAALAASTLADPRRGPGPSLIPRPTSWPFRYVVGISNDLSSGQTVLKAEYVGTPAVIIASHETGAKKPGTNWVLPARPTMGVTPKGWARIKARFAQLPADIRRLGG